MSGENPLHRARVERGIELAEVARRTCLSPHVVRRIDEGRFAELPAGVYARSYVRAFATAVDLDPEETLAGVAEHLPRADDPLPVLRDVAERATPAWITPFAAPMGAIGLFLQSAAARVVPSGGWPVRIRPGELINKCRATLQRSTPEGGHGLTEAWSRLAPLAAPGRRLAALGVDAAVLVVLYTLLVQLTAWSAGVSRESVLTAAGVGVTAVWALLVVQYFVLLGGVGGRTPGAWLFGLGQRARRAPSEPLGLRAILYRTVLY